MKFNFNIKIIYFSLFLLLISCLSGSDKITDEVVGTYAFEFPSGQYELLKINLDHTYSQYYYKDINTFKKGLSPIYSNTGKWSKTSAYQLHFDNYLEICSLGNPENILPKPEYSGQGNVNWYKSSPSSKGALSIYSENGYVLKKI